MASPFIHQVDQDLQRLQFKPAELYKYQPDARWTTYDELQQLVSLTREIGTVVKPTERFIAVQTTFGEHVSQLLRDGFVLGDKSYHAVCESAETYLTDNLTDALAGRPNSGVAIVTRRNEPIGVIKSAVETTCYGLQSDRNTGIVAGGFSSTHLPREVALKLHETDRPLTLAMEQLRPFLPVRLGIFLMHGYYKWAKQEQGQSAEIRAMQTSHETIAQQVAQLFEKAISI